MEAITELLEHGANINAQETENEWTPLHWAAFRSKVFVPLKYSTPGRKLDELNIFNEFFIQQMKRQL